MDNESYEMLWAILNLEEGLSPWEVEFLESLSHLPSIVELSQKRKEKLAELYAKHIGG